MFYIFDVLSGNRWLKDRREGRKVNELEKGNNRLRVTFNLSREGPFPFPFISLIANRTVVNCISQYVLPVMQLYLGRGVNRSFCCLCVGSYCRPYLGPIEFVFSKESRLLLLLAWRCCCCCCCSQRQRWRCCSCWWQNCLSCLYSTRWM